jgi:hypothetical protein
MHAETGDFPDGTPTSHWVAAAACLRVKTHGNFPQMEGTNKRTCRRKRALQFVFKKGFMLLEVLNDHISPLDSAVAMDDARSPAN